jgi:hypothetical protein
MKATQKTCRLVLVMGLITVGLAMAWPSPTKAGGEAGQGAQSIPSSSGSPVSMLGSGRGIPSTVVPTKSMSIALSDDRLFPIDGGVIYIDDGLDPRVLVTDAAGQTPWLALDPSVGVALTLVEASVSSGTTLGMVRGWAPPPLTDEGEDDHQWELWITQPLAVPVLLDGDPNEAVNILPTGGAFPHWKVIIPQGSALRFMAGIGVLMDGESVRQHMAYRGQDVNSDAYVRSIAMVCPPVQTGDDGFIVGIDLHGDVAPGNVAVDVYNFYSDGAVPLPILASEIVAVEGDRVFVRVYGGIMKGILTLLVRERNGSPGVTQYVLDNPPEIEIPTNGGGGQVALAGTDQAWSGPTTLAELAPSEFEIREAKRVEVQGCPVPVPDAPKGWTCTPDAPTNRDGCGPAEGGPTTCRVIKFGSKVVCKDVGEVWTVKRLLVGEHKVTFEVSGGLEAGVVGISATDTFTYGFASSVEETDQMTANAGGDNVGQCMQKWVLKLYCLKVWTWTTHSHTWSPNGESWSTVECNKPASTKTMCPKTMDTQRKCFRTGTQD